MGGWPVWLKLDLDGILLTLRIKGYRRVPDNDWDSTWCKVDFSFISEPWLDYRQTDSEVFLAREIDDLREALEALLTDRLTVPTEFACIEQDFRLLLRPKEDLRSNPKVIFISPGHEMVDIGIEWQVYFWHEGLTGNYLTVSLGREEILALLVYLRLISGMMSEDDPAVKLLTQLNIIDQSGEEP